MYTHTLNLVPAFPYCGRGLEIRIGVDRGCVHVLDVDSGLTGASPIAAHMDHETPYRGDVIALAISDLLVEMGIRSGSDDTDPGRLCCCGCTEEAFNDALDELAEDMVYPSPPLLTVSVTNSLSTIHPHLVPCFDIKRNKGRTAREIRADSEESFFWSHPWRTRCDQPVSVGLMTIEEARVWWDRCMVEGPFGAITKAPGGAS